MSLTEIERQALGSIEHSLVGSDPRLASMLNIFSRLAAGEEIPACEKIRSRSGRRPTAVRAAFGGTRAGAQPSGKRAGSGRLRAVQGVARAV